MLAIIKHATFIETSSAAFMRFYVRTTYDEIKFSYFMFFNGARCFLFCFHTIYKCLSVVGRRTIREKETNNININNNITKKCFNVTFSQWFFIFLYYYLIRIHNHAVWWWWWLNVLIRLFYLLFFRFQILFRFRFINNQKFKCESS